MELIQDKASFQGQKCPSSDNASLRSLEKKRYEDSDAEDKFPVELIQDKESFQWQKCSSGRDAMIRPMDTQPIQDEESLQWQKCHSGRDARMRPPDQKQKKPSFHNRTLTENDKNLSSTTGL